MEQMTAEQARAFDGYSVANVMILKNVLTCNCEPYEDIFTYNRWKAQGYQVKKGEKSHRITIFIEVDREKTDPETGETTVKTRKVPRTSCVFCRCQVEAIENERKAS